MVVGRWDANPVRYRVMPLRHSAFSNAFGASFAAILFLVPGIMGYELSQSDWSFVRTTWTGAPVWWEIWFGSVALLFAVYFWRRALRSLP